MKLLMLYGVNCTKEIWEDIKPYLSEYEIDYVSYPHEITQNAKTVDDITEWVYRNYHNTSYTAIIGHSLGGIIALQLAANYKMEVGKIIYLDTNLKPAEKFYRNLMTPGNMDKYGKKVLQIFDKERGFYTGDLLKSIQVDFDYTNLVENISQKIFAVYGDRGMPEYQNRVQDLNLPAHVLDKLNLEFVNDSCHMIMIENPKQLAQKIKAILENS